MLSFPTWRPSGSGYPRLIGLMIAAILLAGVAGYHIRPVRAVEVQINDQSTIVNSRSRTAAEVLREAGVTIGQFDLVWPDIHERLGDDPVVRILRAVPVKVSYDGVERDILLPVPGVKVILAQQGIALGHEDLVQTNYPQAEQQDFYLRISRVRRDIVVEQAETPFATQFRENTALARGARDIVQEGLPGLVERRVEVTYRDGMEQERKVISEHMVRNPLDRIVAVGGSVVVELGSRMGEREKTGREMTVEATGYSQSPEEGTADGITATGTMVRSGVVAVDPKVIPLGSTLWVEGYGYARAEDTGGAIKGDRIDLFFSTRDEAFQWGRRKVKLYVME